MSQYPQLDEYVKKARLEGKTDYVIQSEMVASGYNQNDINQVFSKNEGLPQKNKSKVGKILFFLLILILVSGGSFYLWDKGILSAAPYNQSNLLSGLVKKMSALETFSIKIGSSFTGEKREKDAVPFEKAFESTMGSSILSSNDLASLNQFFVMIPKEIKLYLEWNLRNNTENDFKNYDINFAAEGDLEDITYKFDLDMIMKEGKTYVRVNNMPSILLMFLPVPIKGEWILVDEESVSTLLAQEDDTVDEFKEETSDLLKKMLSLADEHKIIKIVNKPGKDKIGDIVAYKYELEVNQDGLKLFLEDLIVELENGDYENYSELADGYEDMLEVVQSEDFATMLEYYNENVKTVLWVDKTGNLMKYEATMRIVPSVSQLADTQFKWITSLSFNEINEKIDIEAPVNYKTIEDIMTEYEESISFGDSFSDNSMVSSRNKGADASKKANLNNTRALGELFYDTNGGSYNGVCSNREVVAYVSSAGGSCFNSKESWFAYTTLSDGMTYCVDSFGRANTTDVKINSASGSCPK